MASMISRNILPVAFAMISSICVSSADAQGLIWNLPADGRYVRYEGTVTQRDETDTTAGNITVQWLRQITISSVGQEDAEFEGRTVKCRWIEIKSVTGNQSEAGVDPGPTGSRIYKVLVPEEKIVGNIDDMGETRDAKSIPVSMIPIVRGFRKIGAGAPTPMRSRSLQIYPLISTLMYYPVLEHAGTEPLNDLVKEAAKPHFPSGDADKYTGRYVIENRTSRTTNTATVWVSDDVPFGVAKWDVTVIREEKESSDSRDTFAARSTITVAMDVITQADEAFSEVASGAAPTN